MLTKTRLWKDAFGRQRDVHDLGEVHLEDGQEEFHGRAADLEIFHERDADDGGGINGVLAVRDGKDGIQLGQRVIAGVIAERAFIAQRLGRVNVAFNDEVGLPCRSLVRRLALGKTVFNSGKMLSRLGPLDKKN